MEKKSLVINKNIFVKLQSKTHIRDHYDFVKELGSGAFGVVFLAYNKSTKEKFAVKAIGKDRIEDKEMFQNEISILKDLDHPNILKLFEVYESSNTIYLVTEMCDGGELFYYITKKGFLSENETAIIMRQIFSAVAYCHENKIIHRDLKPENFLLKNADDIESLKLIDFGLSEKVKEGEWLSAPNGTPFYIAPEIIEGKYDFSADNWSAGVILYILLCGRPPFFGKNAKEIISSIKKGVYSFNREPFIECSIEVKDLISKLLVKNPQKRLSALKAFEHPWVKRQVDKESQDLVIDKEVLQGLEKIVHLSNFKKTILLYMASHIPESEIFTKIDANGNGLISKDEMGKGIEDFNKQFQMNLSESQIVKIFEAMDIDNSGQIDYSEFIASFLNNNIYKNDKYLMETFKKIDKDGSGKISIEEISMFFNSDEKDVIPLQGINLTELIEQADSNKDGEIDYHEFLKMMRDMRTRASVAN